MKNNWIVDIESENYGPRKCLVMAMIAWIAVRRTSMMNSSESVRLKMYCATFKPEKLIKCTKF
jgi:hypothetical protein